MVKFVLKDVVCMYGGNDISGDQHTIDLAYSADLQDCTTFGNTARRRLPGLLDVSSSHQGYWDHVDEVGPPIDSLDKDLFEKIAAASSLMSFSADGGQIGEVGFTYIPQAAAYNPGGSIGEVFGFSLECVGDDPLVRGEVMENQAFTVTVNGTARQLGAVSALQTIYSSIHVTAVVGTTPTLDVTVESDDAMGFPLPTVQMTHPQLTGVGSNQQTIVNTVIADDWWRMVMTITGTGGPSFTLFGIIAIQATLTP